MRRTRRIAACIITIFQCRFLFARFVPARSLMLEFWLLFMGLPWLHLRCTFLPLFEEMLLLKFEIEERFEIAQENKKLYKSKKSCALLRMEWGMKRLRSTEETKSLLARKPASPYWAFKRNTTMLFKMSSRLLSYQSMQMIALEVEGWVFVNFRILKAG